MRAWTLPAMAGASLIEGRGWVEPTRRSTRKRKHRTPNRACNQCMLADALGLSALDRMLRMMRERGVMAFQAGRVRIHDLAVRNRAEADRD